MKNELILCEYSYHTERKHFNWRNGLESYFFRLQTEGHSLAKINQETVELAPGDLLLCKPGDSCEILIDEVANQSGITSIGSGDYFIMCRGPWLDEWWERRKRPTIVHIHNTQKFLLLWRQMNIEKRRIYEKNEELLDYLLRAQCLSIDILIKDTDLFSNQLTLPVQAMKSYIEEHANQPFKVEDVANHVSFSVSRASHLFKEQFGKTIIEYAMEIRLNTATKLIQNSDMTLAQIAELSGFGSYNYFHRIFKRKYGTSPTDYFSKV